MVEPASENDWSIARSWIDGVLISIGIAFSLSVVLVFAGLVQHAQWQGDEYFMFGFARQNATGFFLHFFVAENPRPISVVFYWLYFLAVDAARRPLIITCVGVLWSILTVACLCPALTTQADRLNRLLLGSVMLALLLVGHGVGQVFYWPGGCINYLLTLSGMVSLVWCTLDGLVRLGPACLSLIVVAGSSDVGAFTGIAVAIVFFVLGARRYTTYTWLIPGLLLGCLDVGLLLTGRARIPELQAGGQEIYLHDPVASVLIAVPNFVLEFAGSIRHGPHSNNLAETILSRVAILVGARWWKKGGSAQGGRPLILLALAFFAGAFTCLAASFYQFGMAGEERQETMRACTISLALICIGAWSTTIIPLMRPTAWISPVAWIVAVSVLFFPEVAELKTEYLNLPHSLQIHAKNWQSGTQLASNKMHFTLEKPSPMFSPPPFAVGTYDAQHQTWFSLGLLNFFHKAQVEISRDE